jgi:hypothetical protein
MGHVSSMEADCAMALATSNVTCIVLEGFQYGDTFPIAYFHTVSEEQTFDFTFIESIFPKCCLSHGRLYSLNVRSDSSWPDFFQSQVV